MPDVPPVQVLPFKQGMTPQETLYASIDPISQSVQNYNARQFQIGSMGYEAALKERLAQMSERRYLDRYVLQQQSMNDRSEIMQNAMNKRAEIMQNVYLDRANDQKMWDAVRVMQQEIPAKDFPSYDPKQSVGDYYKSVVGAYQSAGNSKISIAAQTLQDLDGQVSDLTRQRNDLLSNPNANKLAAMALNNSQTVGEFSATLTDSESKRFTKLYESSGDASKAAAAVGPNTLAKLNAWRDGPLTQSFQDPQKLTESVKYQVLALNNMIEQKSKSSDMLATRYPEAAAEFAKHQALTNISPSTQSVPVGLPANPASAGSKPGLPANPASAGSKPNPQSNINPSGEQYPGIIPQMFSPEGGNPIGPVVGGEARAAGTAIGNFGRYLFGGPKVPMPDLQSIHPNPYPNIPIGVQAQMFAPGFSNAGGVAPLGLMGPLGSAHIPTPMSQSIMANVNPNYSPMMQMQNPGYQQMMMNNINPNSIPGLAQSVMYPTLQGNMDTQQANPNLGLW
jgi:hypothetical protein